MLSPPWPLPRSGHLRRHHVWETALCLQPRHLPPHRGEPSPRRALGEARAAPAQPSCPPPAAPARSWSSSSPSCPSTVSAVRWHLCTAMETGRRRQHRDLRYALAATASTASPSPSATSAALADAVYDRYNNSVMLEYSGPSGRIVAYNDTPVGAGRRAGTRPGGGAGGGAAARGHVCPRDPTLPCCQALPLACIACRASWRPLLSRADGVLQRLWVAPPQLLPASVPTAAAAAEVAGAVAN